MGDAPVITDPANPLQPKAELDNQMDRELFHKALSMDTQEKVGIYQEQLLQKWSGIGRDGKYNPKTDWVGKGSEERGYPAITNSRDRAALAMLLENQNRYQRTKELRVVGNRVLQQDTTTADEALPTKFVFPLVRRLYAQMMQADWSTTVPMPGPTGYVFYLDFLREGDGTNILSVEYNWMLNGELTVPAKGKMSLQRQTITAVKQIMGMAWSLEAFEDAQAQLGLNVENEMLNAFGEEFVRGLFERHLLQIQTTAGATATGTGLPTLWATAPAATVLPDRGTDSITDYKSHIYNALIDANTVFQRRNRTSAGAIVAGYGLAGLLRKMLTATATSGPDVSNTQGLGVTNYGTYSEHWKIWGTEFLPDNVGFMYNPNPDALRSGHIYSPYIPVQVMPMVYADYDPTTGNYMNKDAWTRNIRERSASTVTRPYAFVQITGPAGGLGQF